MLQTKIQFVKKRLKFLRWLESSLKNLKLLQNYSVVFFIYIIIGIGNWFSSFFFRNKSTYAWQLSQKFSKNYVRITKGIITCLLRESAKALTVLIVSV